jgi:glucose-6-phosphate isomerase
VEAGKKAAAEVLALQERLESLLADGQPRSLEAIQEVLELATPEPIFWALRHLGGNPRGYRISGDWGVPATLQVVREPG